MGLKVITEPTEHGLSLLEAKEYLKVEHDADDITIATLIEAAREHVEKLTWRALAPKTLELSLSAWEDRILLPEPPLKQVDSIVYIDPDGASQTLAAEDYIVDDSETPAAIIPGYGMSWPAARNIPNAIKIRYQCGYTILPKTLKTAMLMLIAYWYENRTANDPSMAPAAVDALADGFKVVRFE